MSRKTLSPASVFEMVLRAHETGGVTFVDVRTQLKELLAAGASPADLLETLRRQQQWEPLPESAHVEVLGLIDEAMRAAPKNADAGAAPAAATATADDAAAPAADEPNDFEEPGLPPDLAGRLGAQTRGTKTERPASAQNLRSLEARIAGQQADYTTLTRSYERAREAESVATARVAALAAELAALKAARESERIKAQQLAETAAQQARTAQAEIRQLRHAEQARAAEFEVLTRRLVERDAQLESLEQERQAMLPQWAAHASQLAEARAALAAQKAKTQEIEQAAAQYRSELRRLIDSSAVRDTELAALQQEHARIVPLLDAKEKAAAQSQADLQAARTALAALEAEHAQRVSSRDAELNTLRASLTARDAALASGQAELRDALARIDRLSRELADREVVVPLPPTLVVAPKPAPALTIVPPVSVAPRPLPSSKPPSHAVPLAQPLRLRVVAAAAGLVLCLLAAYVLQHRSPPTLPATANTPLATPLPKAGTVIRDCLTCPEITVLPTGRFSQGSSDAGVGAAAFEKPLHVVAIQHVIGMATNLVTVDDYQQFITASGWESQGCTTYDGEWKNRPNNSWSNPGFVQTGKHPVTCASWNDAQAYAKWLSAKAGHTYRLPSASEWEYAARAGGTAAVPWSSESAACENANVADKSAVHRYPGWAAFACDDGYVYTSPVGSFKPNAFGLRDMLGNVFQWTEDCWRPDYVGAPIDGSARNDGACVEHELRGGSWFTTPAYVRANYRNHFAADYRSSTVGIRLVRDFES